MKNTIQLSTNQSAVKAFAMAMGSEEATQTLLDFLIWLEQNKGLTLCNAFKPEYDWYMPVFADKEKLAHEFLDIKSLLLKREHLT